ncbi:AAA family ATPase [Leifsonia sp. NPDC058248]|uniref:MinD/ParA family ATP-binding protein n=1 Tax=Leifsonia sp. NPDC058248 TaxID=3346402 RepID=UPI0036D88DA7
MADKPDKGRTGELASDELASSESSSGDVASREPATTDDLAISLPESLSIVVDLPPAPAPEAPEDEVAVAIDDVPVNPGFVASPTEPTTMSVAIVASRLATGPTPTHDDQPREIPPLPGSDPFSQSRRDRLRGEHSQQPEPAAMLTADRLLEVNRKTRPGPEGGWHRFVYAITFHTVNLGDSATVRARKELDHRIQKQFEGGTRFVPVLTRKGGVGKTTVTTLLGMALADAREDRIVAIDANPDRGTLAERVTKQTRATVRDVVQKAPSINGFTDFSALVSRDETRLDILASDTDPLLSEAFDENDYNVVADLTARFYSIVLTDCGTGIVHSVMRATLQRADSVVIVSGGSVDEARLASETLTWLEANGYGELVRNAIVALNTATQGTNLVKLDEIESHFRSRVREVVRIPYDPQLAAGSVVSYKDLKPLTKQSARTLAALVVEGLPTNRG